jgi:restriction system protein
MRPVLELLADGDDHAVKAIQKALAERFSLSREDTEQMLPGGTGRLFANRVGWATTYLYQTNLIDRSRRAVYRITALLLAGLFDAYRAHAFLPVSVRAGDP